MIWCVEDDASIRDIELYALRSTGFEAEGFTDGAAMFAALQSSLPELILLDVMLPGENGVELLRRLKAQPRYRDIPVIMATAKGAEYDKIQSLDLGADDYLVKPFGMMEMVSRIKAVLRRSSPKHQPQLLRVGSICMDTAAHKVEAGGKAVTLTLKEYELLRLFLSHPGMVFTRDALLDNIWGIEYSIETRTVDIHIRTLRQKLGESGAAIQTVRGVGYKLED